MNPFETNDCGFGVSGALFGGAGTALDGEDAAFGGVVAAFGVPGEAEAAIRGLCDLFDASLQSLLEGMDSKVGLNAALLCATIPGVGACLFFSSFAWFLCCRC